MKLEELNLKPCETMCEKCVHWDICRQEQIGEPYVVIRECVSFVPARSLMEWIPIKFRPMTEEEAKEQEEKWGCTLADNEKIMFDCPLPVDGQDILISKSWGVSLDTCTYDPDEGYGLEMNGDWDGVSAWMPLPEKYEERKAI